MKIYRTCFVKTLMALSLSLIFFVSCREDEEISSSTACDILSFKMGELSWDIGETEITHTYPSAILPTPLTPTITLSPGATVNPASGQEQNNFFRESGVTYTVTAEDRKTTRTYIARAIRTPYSGCEILSFAAGGVVWDINQEDSLITYAFPASTKEASYTPMVELSPGARIKPVTTEAKNFFTEQGIKYTVTAEDGKKTKTYTVKARKKSTECRIISFRVNGDNEAWDIGGTDITRTYPQNTPEGPLTPSIELSPGAKIDPPSGVEQNFFTADGVTYTVTAEDTTVTQTYTVKARLVSSECSILSFSAGGEDWTINDDFSITHEFLAGTPEGPLTPTITLSPGAKVSPLSGAEQNFFTGQGVKYTVTAENGTTTQDYTVKATVASAPSSECSILSFSVNGEDWTFDGTNITHAFTDGTESLLAPVIGLSPGATVSPESGAEQDFFTYEGVTYTVTAEDGTTQYYTVRATSGWYNRTDWLVLPRHGYHPWSPDGDGAQTLWPGGNPMLIIDNDLESGWHSPAMWYAPLPQMLIVDMKKSRRVSQIIGEGLYCPNIQLYVTDNLSIDGYSPYTVNWSGEEDASGRGAHYDEWANSLMDQIPETPPAEWGDPTQVNATQEEYPRIPQALYYQFSYNLPEASWGRFLILVFPETSSADGPYIGVFNLEVNGD